MTLADYNKDQEYKKPKSQIGVGVEKGKNKKLLKSKASKLEHSKSMEKEELISDELNVRDSNKSSYEKYLEI